MKPVVTFEKISRGQAPALFCAYADGSLGSIVLISGDAYKNIKRVEQALEKNVATLGDHGIFRYGVSTRDKNIKVSGSGVSVNLATAMPSLEPWDSQNIQASTTKRQNEVWIDGDFFATCFEQEAAVVEQILRTANLQQEVAKRYLVEFTVSNFWFRLLMLHHIHTIKYLNKVQVWLTRKVSTWYTTRERRGFSVA